MIIGDHGEGLGAHGEELHDYFVYQSTIHVPLVMRLPGTQPGRQIVDPVSIIDVAPTILAICGLEPNDSMTGVDLSIRLREDLPGDAGGDADGDAGGDAGGDPAEGRERRYLYCESINPARYGCNPVLGIVSERWKLIRSTRPELYDLQADPGELRNVIGENANRAAFLEAQLEKILTEQTRERSGSGAEPDRETRERLQSLGYLSGSGGNVDLQFDRSRPDAKDYVGAHAIFLEASQATSAGDHARAQRLCAELLADYPRIIDAHLLLGGVAAAQNDLETAEREYRQFLTRLDELAKGADGAVVREQFRSSAVKAHFHLANALIDQGRRAEAIEQYRNAIALDASNADAHFNLGITLAESGDVPRALEQFLTTVSLDADFPEAHYNAGLALLLQGRPQEGRTHLETAIQLNPRYVEPRLGLADIMLSAGDVTGAMTQVRAAREARPDLAEPHLRLARLLFGTGDARGALEVYREAARALPDRADVANELAWILATHPDGRLRDGAEAQRLAEKLVTDHPGQPALRATLAAAYAEVGRFEDAIREQEAVVASVKSSGDAAALQANQEMLERFRRGEALRR